MLGGLWSIVDQNFSIASLRSIDCYLAFLLSNAECPNCYKYLGISPKYLATGVDVYMSSLEDVVLTAALCDILAKQRRPKWFWLHPPLRTRSVYRGSDTLNHLQEYDIDPLSGKLRYDETLRTFCVSWLVTCNI